jgi:hypothetical protein
MSSRLDFWNDMFSQMGGDDHEIYAVESSFDEDTAIKNWEERTQSQEED